MSFTRNPWKLATIAAVLVLLPMATAIGGSGGGGAANKTSAQGASVEMLSSDFEDTDLGTTILSTSIKTSSPQDLLLQVTLECALWTEVVSSTNGTGGADALGRAEAVIEVWIEMDGIPVKIDGADPDGKVVFCSRVHEQEIVSISEGTNLTLRQYMETRSANAFNWITLDAGSGYHTITVKADIEAKNTEGSFADGAIGKRTLVVEPTKFEHGATLI